MTQDFAKRNASSSQAEKTKKRGPKATGKRKVNSRKPSPKPAHQKKPPIWAWILTGIVAVGFVTFLSKISRKPAMEDTLTVTTAKAPPPVEKQSQVKFDFYQILKEHEVDIDAKAAAAAPQQENIHYFIQAASFRNLEDADTQRATIILLNMPVNVEQATDKQGNPWYRVIVGPFNTRSQLAKARSILASHRIKGIVIKRKLDP